MVYSCSYTICDLDITLKKTSFCHFSTLDVIVFICNQIKFIHFHIDTILYPLTPISPLAHIMGYCTSECMGLVQIRKHSELDIIYLVSSNMFIQFFLTFSLPYMTEISVVIRQ